MKWQAVSILLFFLMIGAVGWSYTDYQQRQANEALETADAEQLSTILDRPFVDGKTEWMEMAVQQFDVASALVLFEHDVVLSDEQWVYLADLMTFEEFERMVEAGAPLEVATPEQTLIEGLYSLNDEPQKWRLTHNNIDVSFLNEHPDVLIRTVHDGNTEAFTDLIERMNQDAVPVDTLVPLIQEMGQQAMLEVMMQNGYQAE